MLAFRLWRMLSQDERWEAQQWERAAVHQGVQVMIRCAKCGQQVRRSRNASDLAVITVHWMAEQRTEAFRGRSFPSR